MPVAVSLVAAEDFSPRAALLHGLGWGFALLVVPALLTVLVGLLLVTWRRFANTRTVVTYSAIVLAVAAAVLVPWTVRTVRLVGSMLQFASLEGRCQK